MKTGIILFVLYVLFFVNTSTQEVSTQSSCDVTNLRSCFLHLLDATLSAVRHDSTEASCNQTNFISYEECTLHYLDSCSSTIGPVIATVVRPYVRLLETVYHKSCNSDVSSVDCDLARAEICIRDFFHVLLEGHLVQICRQAAVTLACLEPTLETCSDLPRYLVAMVTDEIHLTSDLVCHHHACSVHLARQCLHDATETLDYPVTIVTQSTLVCSEVRSSLACMTNHTMDCTPDDIPESLVTSYSHMYQFASAYCEVAANDLMLMNIPSDLVSSVYLATIATNKWTSVEDICSLFNTTLLHAANQGKILTTYIEYLLTWQYAMNLNLDKYSAVCLNRQTMDCDWLGGTANQNAVCDVEAAEGCVDVVLLSKLVLEVNLQRRTWQSVCSSAYNMLGCVQHHTGPCSFVVDLSRVQQLTQEVERLVGYECSQLGPGDSQEKCAESEAKCDVLDAITVCGDMAKGIDDICLENEKIYSCFYDYVSGCNSVQSSTAHFYLEWLLINCTTNMSLVADDTLLGVTQCKIQFGYNINNGLQLSSDFNDVACTAISIYQQCLSSQKIPSLATYYMAQSTDIILQFQENFCNFSQFNSQPIGSDFQESESCNLGDAAGQISLYFQMFSNLPFSTIDEQERLCSSFPEMSSTLPQLVSNCSTVRLAVISGAVLFLDNMYVTHCSMARAGKQRSCDIAKAEMCLEDFGAYTYFAGPGSDHCGKLHDTFNCIYKNARGCDITTTNTLVQEVKAMQGMMGNITCPRMQWCDADNTTGRPMWMEEICREHDACQMFGWLECIEQNGLYSSCQSLTAAMSCIQTQLSGCDSLQYLLAKSEIVNFLQQNEGAVCNFVLTDPPTISPVHNAMFECSYYISQTLDVTKEGICLAIGQYLQCLTAIDQSEVLNVWRGILGRNILLWGKNFYIDCQLSDGTQFIVNPEFNINNYTGSECGSLSGQYCLRSLAEVAVAYVQLIPLSERKSVVCERADYLQECVQTQTSGCTSVLDRAMLASAQWLTEAMDSLGVCSSDITEPRSCNPQAALDCITELGLVVVENVEDQSDNLACSKLLTTSACVNKQTSSCDYYIRLEVEHTFKQASTIVRQICTVAPPTSSSDTCVLPGEVTRCDLEEALICMVPIQSLLLTPELIPAQEICGKVPEMKACINRQTSGCDDETLIVVSDRLHTVSHTMNDQCPQMYCEECKARMCLSNLYWSLQLQDVNLCVAISETKLCIFENAQYCDGLVSDSLLQEMALLVGVDGLLCEITLPSCLQTLLMSAYQIVNYKTDMTLSSFNMTSSQNDLELVQSCNEANTAYFCVDFHLTTMEEGQRRDVMNVTLQGIGDVIYDICQGPRLQCYSCVNATSNEECNLQSAQTCAPDTQMCGTVITQTTISKGCVQPNLCQTGCLSDSCAFCCDGDLCNQPWNYALAEPLTCQPQSALWCGFQLMSSLVQNDTVDCSLLQEAISCMSDSTHECIFHKSMQLGLHAQQLLAGEAMSTCMSQNTQCSCGQCTSMILLSIVTSPYDNVEEFCNVISNMYNQTISEINFDLCNLATIQSTAYNLDIAASLVQGVCVMDQDASVCIYYGLTYRHGSSFPSVDGCNMCTCNQGNVACTIMMCYPVEGHECPPVDPGQFGTCVEACSTDENCDNGQMCCSNGCGHTCQEPVHTGDAECYYDNSVYRTGDSFNATDGCNQCFCSNGNVGCTEMYCPPSQGNAECYYDNSVYKTWDSFPATDGCNLCLCIGGAVGCTEMYCPPNQVEGHECPPVEPGQFGTCVEACSTDENCENGQMCCSNGCGHTCQDPVHTGDAECYYDNSVYRTGNSFNATDGCNQCLCSNGNVGCTQMYCPPSQGYADCYYDNSVYKTWDSFTATDGCNLCLCIGGAVGCTEMYCPPNQGTAYCYIGNSVYRTGDSFTATDGCNQCFCINGIVQCAEKYCPPTQVEGHECPPVEPGQFGTCVEACSTDENCENGQMCCSNGCGHTCQDPVHTGDADCNYGNQVYSTGDSFTATDGCNQCLCSNGVVGCTKMYCPANQGNAECNYDNRVYRTWDSFSATDGCNLCLCIGGAVGCTQMYCPQKQDDAACNYGSQVYRTGDSFNATDGCNQCLCSNGVVGCTKMYCPANQGNAECYYDNHVYKTWDSFTATDGCNLCLCVGGAVGCTQMYCPQKQGDADCYYGSQVYNTGDSFTATDGCNQCLCTNGVVGCTEMYCPANQGNAECYYDNRVYRTWDSFTATDGCNLCLCIGGAVGCTQMYCPQKQDAADCNYGNSAYKTGASFTAVDGCNQCFCSNGIVGCTKMNCPPSQGNADCHHDNSVYRTGDSFTAADGCNLCFCSSGAVGCTQMYCPPIRGNVTQNGTCDIFGVHECIDGAALPYLVTMATQLDTSHICMAASQMLRCIEPKVMTCTDNILELVRSAIWWNLNQIQSVCDVNTIIMTYNQGSGQQPTINGTCSLQEAVECLQRDDNDDICSSLRSMTDCVVNFTMGCLSLDMVPVLFELQRHLDLADCDLDIPERQKDPLYPVANCTMEFAMSLNEDMSVGYLQYGNLDGVCHHLEVYVKCLAGAEMTAVGRFYVGSIMGSLSNLMHLCEHYYSGQQQPEPETGMCHECNSYTSLEECDSQPSVSCHDNQVCSTVLQLDHYSGDTMVSKGCADLSWCQAWYGCNPQYASCVYCCYGDMCNAAGNMTSPGSTMPSPSATMTTKSAFTTSRPPTTQQMELCNLDHASVFMVAHIVHLLNFNVVSLRERQHVCQKFEHRLADILESLDPECSQEVTEHVQTVSEWLSVWTDSVCKQTDSETVNSDKCMESLQCVQNFGDFSDKNYTCRTLEESVTCLQSHYPYCNSQTQVAMNRTAQLLHDIDYIICEKNELSVDREPKCVDIVSQKNISAKCNESRALRCVSSLQKAMNNIYMTRVEFCRLVKIGMQCIQDNTYNCSDEVAAHLTPVVMEIILQTGDLCPETWCPVSDHCRLDIAGECISHLEMHLLELATYNGGQVDEGVCSNITKVHHCVMNATEDCYPGDRQTAIQQFNTLAQIIIPLCRQKTETISHCYEHFHVGIDQLLNYDNLFIDHKVKIIAREAIINQAQNMIDGIALPGVLEISIGAQLQGKALPGALELLYNIGALFDGIDLPGVLEYLDNYGHEFGNSSDIVYGLNLPGGYSLTGMNQTNPFIRRRRDAGTTNSTGSSQNNETNNITQFWNDDKTNSSFSNSTNEMDKNKNGDIANGGNVNQDGGLNRNFTNLTDMMNFDAILSALHLSRYDFEKFLDGPALLYYAPHKMEVCDLIHEAYHCLHDNLHLRSLPGKQEFILDTTLELLEDIAMDMCQAQRCHSCNSLDTSDECNEQPSLTCAPLQMCHTEVHNGHYTKGCHSILTCEEECRHSDEPCYCCHGNMCNKPKGPSSKTCDIQKAVDCTQDVLLYTLQEHSFDNTSMIYTAAMCMMKSTTGCYGEAHINFHKAGERILKLLAAVNCSESYGSSFCDLPGAATLTSIVSSPYKTAASMEMTCRLFESTLIAFVNKTSEDECCDDVDSIKWSMISVYNKIQPACHNTSIHLLCEKPWNQSCKHDDQNSTTGSYSNRTSEVNMTRSDINMTKSDVSMTRNDVNMTGSGINMTGSDVIEPFCMALSHQKEQNRSVMCSVMAAMDTCLMPEVVNELTLCSVSSDSMFNRTVECVQNVTHGCTSAQLLPVFVMLRSALMSCPPSTHGDKVMEAFQHQLSDTFSPFATCAAILSNISTILVYDDQVHFSLCHMVDDITGCLETESHDVQGSKMMLSGMMGKLLNLKNQFCEKDVPVHVYNLTCSADEYVVCPSDVCTNTTIATHCPMATCVTDYCSSCEEIYYFRGEDVTEICHNASVNNQCDVEMISHKVTAYMSMVVTSSMQSWYDADQLCRHLPDITELLGNASHCQSFYKEPFNALLSWIQEDVKVTCSNNRVTNLCQQPSCDISMATELYSELGYFLTANSFESNIFCQKVKNTFMVSECVLGDCDMSELYKVKDTLLYMRSQIQSRCPELASQIYCDPRLDFLYMDHKPENDTNVGSRNNTPGTRVNFTTPAPPSSSDKPSPSSHSTEKCNTVQAQWCLFTVTMPGQNETNFCSLMSSAVQELKKCVMAKLTDCDTYYEAEIEVYYRELFSTQTRRCGVDFTQQLFMGRIEERCYIPECSFTEAIKCIDHMATHEEDSCRNLEEIAYCVDLATKGCTDLQQYALREILKTKAVYYKLPEACWDVVAMEMNRTSGYAAGIVGCINTFTQNMTNVLNGDARGPSAVCHLFTSLLTCYRTQLMSPDIPEVMSKSMMHLVVVTKPGLDLICDNTEDITEGINKKESEPGSTCDMDRAMQYLGSYSVTVLLSPSFTHDGQHWVCESLGNGREMLASAMEGCSDEQTQEAFTVYNLVQIMGQLSGVCSPHPFTCQPAEAIECVTTLALVVKMYGTRSHQGDVCRAIQQTKVCIKQTTSRCDQSTQNSIVQTLEPISCKAYTICPMAIEETEFMVESPPSCLDPTDVIHEGGTCNPGRALYCLQDMYGENTDKICMSYSESLKCFFHHLSDCNDDLTIMVGLGHLVAVTTTMEEMCPTRIKPSCDSEEMPGCDLNQLQDCEAILRTAEEGGMKNDMCLSLKRASRCFDVHTWSCPRMMKLFVKAKLLRLLLGNESAYNGLNCVSLHQCSYNYVSLLSDTLSLKSHDEYDIDDFDAFSLMSRNQGWYWCHARLEELDCVYSHLDMLPLDVAIVTNHTLDHMEALYADVCSALFGLQPQHGDCDADCIGCQVAPHGVQSYLPILLSFVEENMNNNTSIHSSFKFCSMYDDWVAAFEENKNCHGNNVTMEWHHEHSVAIKNLHDNHCAMKCNVTLAEVCIDNLKTDISTMTWEDACLSYNKTLGCIDEGVSSCEANVTNQYISLAQQIFANSNIICYTMPTIEITPLSAVMELIEGGASQKIDVTMTTAVGDSCHGNSCQLEVFIVIDDTSTASCLSGQVISQIVTDGCSVYFTESDLEATKSLSLSSRIDHKKEEMSHNATLTLVARLWQDGNVVVTKTVATMTTVVKDMETSGVCMVVSEPQIVTFDGLIYYSFHQGEFILYQHVTLPQKVHVGFQRCSTLSITACPCVVMVQSGDDTFVLDSCRRSFERSHPLEFKVYKNNEVTPHTQVYTSVNRKLFQFVLPSGAIVYVQSVAALLNVWIKPSAMEWGRTSGLCGTYDGNVDNDLTWPDMVVQDLADVLAWRNIKLPNDFVNAWRPQQSLFTGSSVVTDLQTMDNSKCVCSSDLDTCEPVDLVETCDLVQGQDITPYLDLFVQDGGQSTRRKRQTNDLWSDIDVDIMYQPELPSWPSESGWNETSATQYCQSVMVNTALWDICNVVMDTTPYSSSCVTDILLYNTTDGAGLSVEAMKVQCKTAVLYDPSVSLGFNTTQELVTYLLTLTCVSDCSGHGQCVNDVCICDSGYTEFDCSIVIVTVPILNPLSEDLYTVTVTPGSVDVTVKVVLSGDSFINSDSLTCHFEQVEISSNGYNKTGIMTSSSATFLTFGTLTCDVTGTLPLTGLLVSVSNDGSNQSNSVLYIIQDFVCFDCDTALGVCNIQPTSCVIDKVCYAAGAYNPSDACYLCDPITNVWKYKISSSCPTTAPTSSSTSSSTNPTSSSTSPTTSTTSPPSSTTSPTPSTTSPTSSTTSPTSSTTSSASSSTSSSSSTTTPNRTSPPTTIPGAEGDIDQQNRDKQKEMEEQNITTIIIVVGVSVGVILIIVAVSLGIRAKRRTTRRARGVPDNNQPGRISPGGKDLQGRLNPTFHNTEEQQARRNAPVRSAPFNPEGLSGEQPIIGVPGPKIYGDEDGMYRVNMDMFDKENAQQQQMPAPDDPAGHKGQGANVPEYDYAAVDKTYKIPRPKVEILYDNAGPGAARDGSDDIIYDNAQGQARRKSPELRQKSADHKESPDVPRREKIISGNVDSSPESSPRPDYEELDDSTESITHM